MNKKSIKLPAEKFVNSVHETLQFTQSVKEQLSPEYESWCFDYAIIRLYREFEYFMFNCLVALINNDSEALRGRTGVQFPNNLRVDVCEYLIYGGDSYFSLKNRDTLIRKFKKFLVLPDDNHWFIGILKKIEYKDSLELLTGLRNFAAHNSTYAGGVAFKAIKKVDRDRQNMSSCSGVWLKVQDGNRFTTICESLKTMAEEIKREAERD